MQTTQTAKHTMCHISETAHYFDKPIKPSKVRWPSYYGAKFERERLAQPTRWIIVPDGPYFVQLIQMPRLKGE